MRSDRRRPTPGGILSLVTLTGLCVVSIVRAGPLPKLGPFLDPVRGVWSAARQATRAAGTGRILHLEAPVTVRYDDRGVPHIFARSERDATRALGFVVARDRLFQLELQWRAGAGRLTELVGSAALDMDRDTRRFGLPDAAAARMAGLPADAAERLQLEAFADGVNAWIDGLGPMGIPLEYHLLGRRPARWEPVHSLHLMGRMGWTLAQSDLEVVRALAEPLVGPKAADALYPANSPIQEPLEPNGQTAPRYDFTPLPPPVLKSAYAGHDSQAVPSRDRWTVGPPRSRGPEFDALGSNNWAVAPARTAAGHAVLAGDQHLELTLPSIWYEAHLVVPDSLDVYGVTIPGAPGIILGFTRDIAWTFTNTEADVMDRYAEVVDDSLAPTRYRVDGAWRDLRIASEPYADQAGRPLAVDTIRYTHRGPMTRQPDGRWVSIRWTMLEENGALAALSRAARATTVAGWLDAMTPYRAPAQNMLVADRQGTIAIRSTGRFPIRPSGRGDRVERGDTSASDWIGEWSPTEVPQSRNPAQGYLASANQQPIDPHVNPRYLGANWYAPWRAIRINTLLRADSAVTPDVMRQYQTDPGSAAADVFVPALLAAARRFPARAEVQRAAALLAEWDRRYTTDNTRAVLYEEAMRQVARRLWDELQPADAARRGPPWPANVLIAALLPDSSSVWWDVRATRDTVERRDDVLAEALPAALVEVTRRHGEPAGGGWRWDRVRTANIYHLLYLPTFSALGVPVQGGQSTLNPSSGDGGFGPSWRMVVELGPAVRGWGVFPGGQSGNPASRHYDDRVETWSAGQLDTLRFPATPEALEGRVSESLTLERPR